MTAAELLASLPEGTTPGPWRFDSHPPAMVLAAGDPGCVGTFPMNHGRFTTLRPADAALIAAAPALVDALRAVLAERDEARAELAADRQLRIAASRAAALDIAEEVPPWDVIFEAHLGRMASERDAARLEAALTQAPAEPGGENE